MRDIRKRKLRGETVLQRLLKQLNGDAADVRFLMRSGMDFDTAVAKVDETRSHADLLVSKCLLPITGGGDR